MNELVVDASGLVEALLQTELGQRVDERLRDHVLHAPSHVDVEVLSALGRIQRAGDLTEQEITQLLAAYVTTPIERHALPTLLSGAWALRHNLRLADALYVELARHLDLPFITTDHRLATAADGVECLR